MPMGLVITVVHSGRKRIPPNDPRMHCFLVRVTVVVPLEVHKNSFNRAPRRRTEALGRPGRYRLFLLSSTGGEIIRSDHFKRAADHADAEPPKTSSFYLVTHRNTTRFGRTCSYETSQTETREHRS